MKHKQRRRRSRGVARAPNYGTKSWDILHAIERLYEQTSSPVRIKSVVERDAYFLVYRMVSMGLLRHAEIGVLPVWAAPRNVAIASDDAVGQSRASLPHIEPSVEAV
jgi:hypothetical protein